ncbi:MAG: hypothetical protein SGCHY_000258 [Lobulomycetales sp.]
MQTQNCSVDPGEFVFRSSTTGGRAARITISNSHSTNPIVIGVVAEGEQRAITVKSTWALEDTDKFLLQTIKLSRKEAAALLSSKSLHDYWRCVP